MPTFPLTWYIITAMAVANLFTGYMWQQAGHQLEVIKISSAIAEKESERIIAEQKQITEDTTNAWKAALDVTRNDWSKRLRDANIQPMPGISGPAGGVASLSTDSLALAAQCAETTLQLKSLQSWVTSQRNNR